SLSCNTGLRGQQCRRWRGQRRTSAGGARAVSPLVCTHLLLAGNEPPHPLAVLSLAGVYMAFRVDGNHVQAEELPPVLARAAQFTDHLAVLPIEEPNAVVGEIGDIQEPLCLVGRKGHTSGGTALSGIWRQNEFLQELAFFRSDLNSVGIAICSVDQAVIRDIQREMALELLGHQGAGAEEPERFRADPDRRGSDLD